MKASKHRRHITRLFVEGFKSLATKSGIEIGPLTLLAGANSSGKSSILQPVLLLKQTLEAPYDPGPLLLSDSHARFTSAEQILARMPAQRVARQFSVGMRLGTDYEVESTFRQKRKGPSFELVETSYRFGERRYSLRSGMSSQEVAALLKKAWGSATSGGGLVPENASMEVRRRRCFLEWRSHGEFYDILYLGEDGEIPDPARELTNIIHVPGLRGNPARTYKTTAVGEQFPGTFENYVASIVSSWQNRKDPRLRKLGEALGTLGLTWKVRAKPVDATQAELQVARLAKKARGAALDVINIADVGLGVSQILPVLVALLTARPGQLVYLEQPEIHLHPRAQVSLAGLLVEAAERGVVVVAETHSALLLLALQTRVAQGDLDPELVQLHWFRRRDDGTTEITSGQLDPSGAYGDWPEDFGSVILEAESRYLDAAEAAVSSR